jgi:hypothetical protein
MDAVYFPDIGAAMTAGGESAAAVKTTRGKPGFKVTLGARTPREQVNANTMVADLRKYSQEYARWFSAMTVVTHSVEWQAGAAAGGIRMDARGPAGVAGVAGAAGATGAARPDPLMPDEDSINDTQFKIIWFVEILNDGVVLDDVKINVKTKDGKDLYAYVLGKEVEMFPDFDTSDAMADKKKIVKLPAGTKLTVEDFRIKATVSWYSVKAFDAGGKSLGAGWISGADVNQQLKPAR